MRLAAAAIAAFFLCHCAPGSGDGGRTLSGHALGVEKGSADAAAGLSCLPSRYESEYSQADRDAFFRGYEKGYRRERR